MRCVKMISMLMFSVLCVFSVEARCAEVEECDSVWISIGRSDSLLVSRSMAKLCEDHAVLYAPSLSYDAGKVNYKREVKHNFKIINIGSKPLVIFSVRTASSSMKVKVTRKPLGSGESASLRVEYEADKMPLGNFMRNIEITSNSCDGSITIFTLSGYACKLD